MYTLMNGSKVENLTFTQTGFDGWEQSQFFWRDGKKVCEMYNGETGEIKWVDANGKEIVNFGVG